MANILRNVNDMGVVIGFVTTDMLNMIGDDHPRMTQRDRDMKAAQRHIVLLFAEQLGETWVLPADVQVKNAGLI